MKMKKTYTASYKYEGQLYVRDFEGYASKKALAEDLRANGFKVRVIAEPDKFDAEVEKFGARCERHNSLRKHIRDAYRDSGMVWGGKMRREDK
jgi:uncharacterized lipoprotein YajG